MVDILPTMAQMLNIQTSWKVDGVSATDLESPEREKRTVYQQSKRSEALRSEIPRSAPCRWRARY